MTLSGRNLTIGYSDRVVGRGLDVTLAQGEVLALLGPERQRQDHAAQDAARHPQAARRRGADRRPLARRYSIRERARRIAYVPQLHTPTFAFTVETVVLMGRTAHGNLFSRPSAKDRAVADPRARRVRHRASHGSGPTP